MLLWSAWVVVGGVWHYLVEEVSCIARSRDATTSLASRDRAMQVTLQRTGGLLGQPAGGVAGSSGVGCVL